MTSIARFIQEIGRGATSARALNEQQAQAVMGHVLDRDISDHEIGAFALAMRMKGETLAELIGFARAVQARCLPLAFEAPVVVIPSYNGARRLPNLTALLAMRLAQEGARVLVHGPRHDPARTTTAAVFAALGITPASHAQAVRERWQMHEPAFMPTEVLCPPLQSLLNLRWVLGVRNAGHTVAKLLKVIDSPETLQLASHTHPEFGGLMAAYAERTASNLLLLRGTEGEAVADPRRRPRMTVWLGGAPQDDLGCPAQEGVLTALPLLPRQIDAAATAVYIQGVLAGEKPAPPPLDHQVGLVLRALARLADAPASSLRA